MSLINTLTGMKIDINRKTFALANKTGGVSGPIVKPIAVRMVYQVAQAVNIPIIGMGGISSAEEDVYKRQSRMSILKDQKKRQKDSKTIIHLRILTTTKYICPMFQSRKM